MSGFYRQCRWYWTLTDTINSVDRFCFWNGSSWWDWSELDTFSRHWVSRWYIFIITLNVKINFDWHYQFNRSFLPLKWFILMRLIRTWHLISCHWVSRCYIFIITINVRILPTMQVILNFDWHYQFSRSFLLLKWFILMRLIRTWHLISRHWVSRWYIFIITLNVRILPTMQVILNFDWHYQFNRSFLPLKWFILMRLIRTWHLISRQLSQ